MIRETEGDKEFKKKLQNPLKPVNDTKISPELEEYLHKMNTGQLESEETKQRRKQEERQAEESKRFKLFCAYCRRQSLKITPQRTYACFHCGLNTNTPLRMAED